MPPTATEPTDQPVNESTDQLLDLSSPERIVRLKFGQRSALHVFRRLTLEDWLGYLKLCPTELVAEGDAWTPESNAPQAADWLWSRAVTRLEGYKAGEDWKQKMPLAHKLAAVTLLQEVYLSETHNDPFEIEAESRTVVLEAAWNLQRYENLVHRFRLPWQDEAYRYRRLTVQWYRQRGQRQQGMRIRMALALRPLCDLYDQLIEAAEGYAWPSGTDVRGTMDPLHKSAAISVVFEPPEAAEGEAIAA